jgi:hypothetical protein
MFLWYDCRKAHRCSLQQIEFCTYIQKCDLDFTRLKGVKTWDIKYINTLTESRDILLHVWSNGIIIYLKLCMREQSNKLLCRSVLGTKASIEGLSTSRYKCLLIFRVGQWSAMLHSITAHKTAVLRPLEFILVEIFYFHFILPPCTTTTTTTTPPPPTSEIICIQPCWRSTWKN